MGGRLGHMSAKAFLMLSHLGLHRGGIFPL